MGEWLIISAGFLDQFISLEGKKKKIRMGERLQGN